MKRKGKRELAGLVATFFPRKKVAKEILPEIKSRGYT